MSFQRLRDIIVQVRRFHTELSAHFHALNDTEQQERVRMLLDYLSRHESHMARVLKKFEQDASPKVLDTWFQYTVPFDPEAEKLPPHPNLSMEEVIDRATRFDECLVDLYKTLALESGLNDIKEVCEQLVLLEESERSGRSRSIAGLQQDM